MCCKKQHEHTERNKLNCDYYYYIFSSSPRLFSNDLFPIFILEHSSLSTFHSLIFCLFYFWQQFFILLLPSHDDYTLSLSIYCSGLLSFTHSDQWHITHYQYHRSSLCHLLSIFYNAFSNALSLYQKKNAFFFSRLSSTSSLFRTFPYFLTHISS